ncbi:hypothetical protein QBC35DRAFT_477542 [Podospora australis]|uniref:Uncharacterized protein n=1 Tax=Podospora australis TaxID=1536484 RepID=A0AAN6WLP2_9PEZI|nr:hypothetical protein QBC35DRAFT_477542 [Podospora australis]
MSSTPSNQAIPKDEPPAPPVPYGLPFPGPTDNNYANAYMASREYQHAALGLPPLVERGGRPRAQLLLPVQIHENPSRHVSYGAHEQWIATHTPEVWNLVQSKKRQIEERQRAERFEEQRRREQHMREQQHLREQQQLQQQIKRPREQEMMQHRLPRPQQYQPQRPSRLSTWVTADEEKPMSQVPSNTMPQPVSGGVAGVNVNMLPHRPNQFTNDRERDTYYRNLYAPEMMPNPRAPASWTAQQVNHPLQHQQPSAASQFAQLSLAGSANNASTHRVVPIGHSGGVEQPRAKRRKLGDSDYQARMYVEVHAAWNALVGFNLRVWNFEEVLVGIMTDLLKDYWEVDRWSSQTVPYRGGGTQQHEYEQQQRQRYQREHHHRQSQRYQQHRSQQSPAEPARARPPGPSGLATSMSVEDQSPITQVGDHWGIPGVTLRQEIVAT